MDSPKEVSLSKRPSTSTTAPSSFKRPCVSPRTSSPPPKTTVPPIPTLLHLPEETVWSLRKSELRAYFLALQSYALNPHPLHDTSSPSHPPLSQEHTQNAAPFLRLPLEIRQHIYTTCLSTPSQPPHRGPHPRQLQNTLHLSTRFPPSLLLLNRQIHAEALPILYGAPSQEVSIKIDYNIWAHKTCRSSLTVSPTLASAIRHINLSIHLGSEKRANRPRDSDADARVQAVVKGLRKVRKWLAGADVRVLRVDWQEPANCYAWEVKRGVLDGLRGLRAERVEAGEVNWGLEWNRGKKYRFEAGYLKELERARQTGGLESEESLVEESGGVK